MKYLAAILTMAAGVANAECVNPENFTFLGEKVGDLQGPALVMFMRDNGLHGQANELVVYDDGEKGHGHSVTLIFAVDRCAVGKGVLPASLWLDWLAGGKES